MGKIKFIKEHRRGVTSKLLFGCDTCCKILHVQTQPENTVETSNEALVWGSLNIGIGFSQLQELLSVLNTPTMAKKTYNRYEINVWKKWKNELCQQMKKAAEEERKLAIAEGSIENGVPYITVVVDGGWAKRSYGHGYSSMSGVACIIGEKTKKLLFIGPPTAMEQEIIVEGFNRSEQDYGIRYKYVIGDGDSSVYAQTIKKVSYGRFVQTLECANHVTRAFTSNLHKITTKTNYTVETRRILRSRISRFTVNVRTAITRCNNVQILMQDLRNLPYHIFGSHDSCRDVVCTRKLNNEENLVGLLQEDHLFEEIKKCVDNVVRKADRLQKNVTTNYAERCVGAALAYNLGPSWHLALMNKPHLNKFCERREQLRLQKIESRKKLKARRRQPQNTDSDLHYGPNAQEALPDLPEEEFKSNMAKKLAELTKEAGNSVEIERQTIGQHVNPLWLNIRRDRLTASNFGTICRGRPSTSCHAIVQKLLYAISGEDEMNLPASIRYGRLNESTAIQEFVKITGLAVNSCGFFIYKDAPFLGASPDGLVGQNSL
ncbi:hypothetical protein ILUMI_16179, partial [Ignelater luminosus]